MASGRLILPITEPIQNSIGTVTDGATLTVFLTGTATLADLFSDAGLTTPITNPQTSNSAGRFYDQTTVIWADADQAYDCTVDIPGGGTLTYDQLYLVGASTNVSGFAPLDSPHFTGVPTAPTPASNDNSNTIATTAYVQNQHYAPLNSPGFTGTPTAPTASPGTNTTQLATTAFVEAAVGLFTSGTSATGQWFQIGPYIFQSGVTIAVSENDGPQTIVLPKVFPTGPFPGMPIVTTQNPPVNGSNIWAQAISASTTNIVVLQQAEGGHTSDQLPINWFVMGH